jgi:hypothetical protein
MAENMGKKRWRWEPEFDRQFKEGKEHITCPKCNASLGDHWTDRGRKQWRAVPEFRQQFQDGRRHVTCPRCSLLVGSAFWLPPTFWDRVSYLFGEHMDWRGKTIASVALGVLVTLGFDIFAFAMHPEAGFCIGKIDLSLRNACGSGDKSLWWAFWGFGLPTTLFGLFVFYCIPNRRDSWRPKRLG